MRDSSYSSVAPKPLHRLHAPRGLLNEKSCGVGVGARVPSFAHSKRSVKRHGPAGWLKGGEVTGSVKGMTASPSPSRNAVEAVEREVFVGFFCSIATAGESPSTESTSGFSIRSRNCLAYADSDSTYRR